MRPISGYFEDVVLRAGRLLSTHVAMVGSISGETNALLFNTKQAPKKGSFLRLILPPSASLVRSSWKNVSEEQARRMLGIDMSAGPESPDAPRLHIEDVGGVSCMFRLLPKEFERAWKISQNYGYTPVSIEPFHAAVSVLFADTDGVLFVRDRERWHAVLFYEGLPLVCAGQATSMNTQTIEGLLFTARDSGHQGEILPHRIIIVDAETTESASIHQIAESYRKNAQEIPDGYDVQILKLSHEAMLESVRRGKLYA